MPMLIKKDSTKVPRDWHFVKGVNRWLVNSLRNRFHVTTLQWRRNGHDGVSNHQPHHCLLNCLFRRRSKKRAKLRDTGLCAENYPVGGQWIPRTNGQQPRKKFPFDDVIMKSSWNHMMIRKSSFYLQYISKNLYRWHAYVHCLTNK